MILTIVQLLKDILTFFSILIIFQNDSYLVMKHMIKNILNCELELIILNDEFDEKDTGILVMIMIIVMISKLIKWSLFCNSAWNDWGLTVIFANIDIIQQLHYAVSITVAQIYVYVTYGLLFIGVAMEYC